MSDAIPSPDDLAPGTWACLRMPDHGLHGTVVSVLGPDPERPDNYYRVNVGNLGALSVPRVRLVPKPYAPQTEPPKAYPLALIPAWCGMAPADHLHLGGCWGILHGHVADDGAGYCSVCEHYSPVMLKEGKP